MPFKSQAQQRFMFSQHPKIAQRWAKETPSMKSLPPHVPHEEMMQNTWDHPGCEDRIGKVFVVLKPGPESMPHDIVHQTHAFGMGQFDPQSVHGVYTEKDEANLVAEAACTELRKHLGEVEKKKDTVLEKIEKHINRLQKEINGHMKEATEIPEMSEKHHSLAERKMGMIKSLREKHRMVKAAKKQLPEIEDKKKLNESILGTIALAYAITSGVTWLKDKKKQIAAANKKDEEERERAEENARKVKAVEQATEVLEEPENKKVLDQIRNDREIKTWISTLDNAYAKAQSDWVARGGGSPMSDEWPPTWGDGKEDLIKKIEDKIKTFPGGEKILDAMNTHRMYKPIHNKFTGK